MSTGRHARVREVFLAVCDLPEPERQAVLADTCGGDQPLRHEVEALLSHHQEATAGGLTVASRPGSADGERFEAGHVFAGRYRIISELGRGGMGEVFRAHDLVLDEPVAIKLLPRAGRQHLSQLLNEVRMARQVTHPNVCRVFDFGDADGETYLTMEYIDGEDLSSLLKRIGRFPRDKLLDIAHQLCAGLAAAHGRGVLHRDLKPANIMIDGQGRARITDFGIASLATPGEPDAWAPIIGTPAYMAPEQIANGEVSVQSDLYALGLVLHEMATGQPVFEAATPMEYIELHRSSTPTPPSHHVEHVDPQLEAVIARCLEKDPRDRPTSAGAVAAALPGGDRLRRAIEAGETPSPEIVAAAGRDEALRTGTAAALLSVLLLFLTGILLLGDRAYPGRAPWASKSPEVLADRAIRMVRDLGHPDAPLDRAWGFLPDFGGANEATGVFWYRQSPAHLVPAHLFVMILPRVDFDDPPPLEEGMIRMLLHPDGRLLYLHAVPESPEEAAAGEISAETEAQSLEPPVSWDSVLAAAGFESRRLESSTPETPPPIFADQRAAWITSDEDPPKRIEAAAYRGRIVFFEVTEPADESEDSGLDFSGLWDIYMILGQVFWSVLAVAAIVLARANLRAGRGDLPRARRLALLVIAANLAVWLLEADHVPDLEAELFRLQATVGRVLLDAVVAWLAYIALEPTVRRWWPRALIAWSRLLRGRLVDPLVGRGLLIGAVTGAGWALLTLLDRLATDWLGLEPAGEIFILPQLEIALNGRLLIAAVLDSGIQAVVWGVLDLFFLVVLRVLLRRWWLAVSIFVLWNGALETLEGIHPAVSWLTLGVGIAGVTVFVMMRFGLLAYAAALFCYFVLIDAPATLSFDAWFADTGLFALALVAAVGIFGFWTALADHPFASDWFEPQLSGAAPAR